MLVLLQVFEQRAGADRGAFVHSKHDTRSLPGVLRGWWGHERSTRFEMNQEPVYRAARPV